MLYLCKVHLKSLFFLLLHVSIFIRVCFDKVNSCYLIFANQKTTLEDWSLFIYVNFTKQLDRDGD